MFKIQVAFEVVYDIVPGQYDNTQASGTTMEKAVYARMEDLEFIRVRGAEDFLAWLKDEEIPHNLDISISVING